LKYGIEMKPKIAFIASYPSSLLNFRLALMQEFLSQGFTVIAIAPYDEQVEKELEKFGIKLISIGMQRNGLNPFLDMALIFKLWHILLNERPDIIFSYTIKPIIYGSFAAWVARVPRIYSMVTGTGYIFLDTNFKNKLVGW